jgi:hypothetical protein
MKRSKTKKQLPKVALVHTPERCDLCLNKPGSMFAVMGKVGPDGRPIYDTLRVCLKCFGEVQEVGRVEILELSLQDYRDLGGV